MVFSTSVQVVVFALYHTLKFVRLNFVETDGLVISHLPEGPTAHFRMSSVRLRKEIKRKGKDPTKHQPEVILNNFTTRLGHSIGRMFASLFPHDPQFIGRQVATFHNQRDYIFFRFHRYIFKNEKRVAIQELGPRFTLKLRSLQKGTFDSKFGEYEWIHKYLSDWRVAKMHLRADGIYSMAGVVFSKVERFGLVCVVSNKDASWNTTASHPSLFGIGVIHGYSLVVIGLGTR
ncbi:Ribosome production factor 1 [Varanus komodoensis]|nr:Ribosome production factor 1 [Varanus komodoensis]